VNDRTDDLLHLLTRERLDQRAREASAERLANQIRATTSRRPRLLLTARLPFAAARRATAQRLEA
jgi:hypothetical protein